MKSEFYFSHYYDKFNRNTFTTVRGKSAFRQYIEGDIVDVVVSGGLRFKARIMHKSRQRICDIPLSVLQADVKSKKYDITSRADFITILNSFRRYHKIESESDIVTIFFLSKEIYPPANTYAAFNEYMGIINQKYGDSTWILKK